MVHSAVPELWVTVITLGCCSGDRLMEGGGTFIAFGGSFRLSVFLPEEEGTGPSTSCGRIAEKQRDSSNESVSWTTLL